MTKWAVVQDLRPFGYKFFGVYRSRRKAERHARRSPYRQVMPADVAEAEDRRMAGAS